jgi:hypothetical protein
VVNRVVSLLSLHLSVGKHIIAVPLGFVYFIALIVFSALSVGVLVSVSPSIFSHELD